MSTTNTLLQIFVVGVGLNIVWEFSHCWLYETCRRQLWQKNIALLLTMAVKDGFLIVVFYVIATRIFSVTDILASPIALGFFVLLSAGFSFIDEKAALHLKRWEYAPAMPTIFGVGLTPLLEIAVTGVVTFVIVASAHSQL